MGVCATLQNTRGDNCPAISDIAKRMIFVPELGKDGSKNEIATVAGVTKAALQSLFDDNDVLDRYYPIDAFENVEDIRADAEFFEFNSGRKAKTKDGVRTFTAFIPFQGAEYLGKLKEWGCNKFGVYIIDKADNFIYSADSSAGVKVQPIMVDNGSFSAELMKKTEGEPAMIKITFDFRATEKDELLRVISEENLDFSGLSTIDTYGLWNVTHAVTSISTTGWVSTVTETIYGFAVEGLLIGDFSAYNDTDSAAVTISSVTEGGVGSEGVYTFVVAAETSADSITVSMTKSGYDDIDLEAVKVLIP
jgi:hypothetical protein